VLRVIKNATRWAYNPAKPWVGIHPAPNVPADKAPIPLTIKGPRLHADGEEGYR
jgi:trehalose utilization protein